MNKDIKGLEKYISEKVLTTLSTGEKQKVKEFIKCLENRYGKRRLEKVEELAMRFREDEADLLQAMEEI